MTTIPAAPSRLSDLTQRLILFPVRHFSPTAARLVADVITTVRPAAVLVEGPSDFNDRFDDLLRPHRLPVALYSFVALADGRRSSAFHPLCDFSPEWQALQAGRAVGAALRFIDLPYAALVASAPETAAPEAALAANRYGDGALRGAAALLRLGHALGVDNLDDLWDALFEVDGALSAESYLTAMHHFCATLAAVTRHDLLDQQRNAAMAHAVWQALHEFSGPIVVVVGGLHAPAVADRLARAAELGPPPPPDPLPPDVVSGIALTPYSYARLDRLTGFDAGMPSPGFYHHVWHHDGDGPVHRALLAQVADRLRRAQQPVSAADLIAVETTARALADLRGHRRVWRRDLVDGIISALVKDELVHGYAHAFLGALFDVLRGDRIGRLADGTARPPLVDDIDAQLTRHDLQPTARARRVVVDLLQPAQQARSRVLHQLRMLNLPGFALTAGMTAFASAESTRETWRLVWEQAFAGAAVEAAVYGPTLAAAARARLLERARRLADNADAPPSARDAADLLLDSALIGAVDAVPGLTAWLTALVNQDGRFQSVAPALARLLTLYRFDAVLGTSGIPAVGDLLAATFRRALWLLAELRATASGDWDALDGVRVLLETFERCGALLGIGRTDFLAVFERIADGREHAPLLRGAAVGVLWTTGAGSSARVLRLLRTCADPAALGDFLAGLFALARDSVPREAALLTAVDELLAGYDDDAFLRALPALRLAFTHFTPREKHFLAETLFGDGAGDEVVRGLAVSAETAAAVLAWENRLYATLARYGLAGAAPEEPRDE